MSAVLIIAIMLSVTIVPTATDDSDAVPPNSWACRITVDGTSLTTEYSVDGSDFIDTVPVKGFGDGKTEGSWGYDEDGYGPFGSFYAAFDPANKNQMVCHLNPYDLTESVDHVDISSQGYNIMWCLPKIYLSLSNDGSTITLASDDSYGGELAPAFTLKDDEGNPTDYEYLALGVYEATTPDDVGLGSVSGTSPKNGSQTDTRDMAKMNAMTDDSISRIWNFHQYQLYRLCSLAVMENFDSQEQVGYGNCSAGYGSAEDEKSRTGTMDKAGPYTGTAGQNDDGVKLFIENAWGSLVEFVDDIAKIYNEESSKNEFWVGQSVDVTETNFRSTSNKVKIYFPVLSNASTTPLSMDLTTWGFFIGVPTSSDSDILNPDLFHTMNSSHMNAGGSYMDGLEAGLSYIAFDDGGQYYGSRLTFLFSDDPGERHSITFDMNDGTSTAEIFKVLPGQEFMIPADSPTWDGYEFEGWSDGTTMYQPGSVVTIKNANILLTAMWVKYTPPDPPAPFIPIFPESEETIEVVENSSGKSWLDDNEKTTLLTAIAVIVIAELTVLTISRKR